MSVLLFDCGESIVLMTELFEYNIYICMYLTLEVECVLISGKNWPILKSASCWVKYRSDNCS